MDTSEEFEKFYKDLSDQNRDLLKEIQELEMEVLEILELCFDFAGLKDKYLQDALSLYASFLDEHENEEYSKDKIKALILRVKKTKPEWFK